MTKTPPPNVWSCLRYDDTPAAVKFLQDAFGFEPILVVEGDSASTRRIPHAEMLWPEGGGVMLGSTSSTDGVHAQMSAGQSSTYVVTSEPDALFARATAAGAAVVQGLRDEDYGSRGFTVRDFEGNLWSFGTYAGAEH